MDQDENSIVMYLQEEAKCPYCHQALEKIPQKKTRCKNCNQHFFIRTRPSDYKKVIVTQDGVGLIDEQWVEAHRKREAERIDEALKELPEGSPDYKVHHLIANKESLTGNYDVAWSHYKKALESAYIHDVSTRGITVDMIMQLEREGKKDRALQMTCHELCGDALRYIDREVEDIVRSLPPGLAIDSYMKELNYDRFEFRALAKTWCEEAIRSDQEVLEKIVNVLEEFAFNRPPPMRRRVNAEVGDIPEGHREENIEIEVRYCGNCGSILSDDQLCPKCNIEERGEDCDFNSQKVGLIGKIKQKLFR